METTNKTVVMEFVDKLFKEHDIKFEKTANGEYNIDGDIFLDDFPELVVDGKFIIKFGKVSGFFGASGLLTSLEGCPREVGESFSCMDCNGLTNLKGAPEKVGRDFICCSCINLKNLEGAPQKVGRDFDCSECDNLTSLEGCPRELVVGYFWCTDCIRLRSLKGAPEKIGRHFDCRNCGTQFTEEDVKEVCDVAGRIFVAPDHYD